MSVNKPQQQWVNTFKQRLYIYMLSCMGVTLPSRSIFSRIKTRGNHLWQILIQDCSLNISATLTLWHIRIETQNTSEIIFLDTSIWVKTSVDIACMTAQQKHIQLKPHCIFIMATQVRQTSANITNRSLSYAGHFQTAIE